VLKSKNLIIAGIIGMIVVLAGSSSIAQVKLGYIDSQRILMNYQGAIDAQKKLESERNSMALEFQKLQEEFTTGQQNLEQQSMLLSEQSKREKEKELQNLVLRIQQFQQEKEQELLQRRDELLKPVYEKINEAITKIGEDEGFDLIFDAASLLFAKDAFDLTDKMLVELGEKPTTSGE